MGPSWRLSFTTRIDPALRSPVYLQIIQAVIRDIENGRLAPQASMPSSRELAGILGVNRKTVVLAYEDLIAQGWLETLDLARQFGFAIIEDDYDHEFHFASQPLLPMAAYALQHVIYAGSLSKLLLPALRLGYIAAPAPVIDAVAHIVSWTDGMGNSITEAAANELIETGELRRHARKTRKVYAKRRTGRPVPRLWQQFCHHRRQ